MRRCGSIGLKQLYRPISPSVTLILIRAHFHCRKRRCEKFATLAALSNRLARRCSYASQTIRFERFCECVGAQTVIETQHVRVMPNVVACNL